jgi:uncharacterized protein YceH (UPF0502 family)
MRVSGMTSTELRILGCLIEKRRTTPDVYPLSLNSLRLACNQSTNRDPVVDYDEETIRDGMHRLERRGLARLASGSRTAKYRHLLAEALPMDDGEEAVMAVLMLRGPQTPGELKQRADRMHPFPVLDEVHLTLERLLGRNLVVRLERRPGQKEERYSHLLGEEEKQLSRPEQPAAPATTPALGLNGSWRSDTERRLAELERRVALLEAPSGFATGDQQRGGGEP